MSATAWSDGTVSQNAPPIGNLGLPVVNWRKSRRSASVISLMTCRRFLTLRLSMLKPWSALMESISAEFFKKGNN